MIIILIHSDGPSCWFSSCMLLARGLNNENRFNDKNEMKENLEVKLIKDTVPLSKQIHNMIRYNVAGGRWV